MDAAGDFMNAYMFMYHFSRAGENDQEQTGGLCQ
jgi:hypothetical protein